MDWWISELFEITLYANQLLIANHLFFHLMVLVNSKLKSVIAWLLIAFLCSPSLFIIPLMVWVPHSIWIIKYKEILIITLYIYIPLSFLKYENKPVGSSGWAAVTNLRSSSVGLNFTLPLKTCILFWVQLEGAYPAPWEVLLDNGQWASQKYTGEPNH